MRIFISLVLFTILLVLCWPLALLVLLLYPFIWLLLLPFRILGWGVGVSLGVIGALILLPFHLLK
ncbi:hypothetical protein [Pleomorphovibrio marinus]|uniref:hypothetical protein n=1 Tax=Pleomorphovibrio marinus TaxID=2164132 RepID=UPI000E0C0C80|nr:hypothetical protein [Pleomorphovibrio marinus]